MNFEGVGRLLLIAGLGLALLGGLIWLMARFLPGLSQFPGTIKFQAAGLTCVFPLLASILLSVILTVLLNLAARFLNK